ncbi:MAG: hypothetical protein HY566_00115 [Candidatus Kerfeldbacteria bacterium]|nr:hypothetical protein [Candidatus Kerfeldbacteria bacterium]
MQNLLLDLNELFHEVMSRQQTQGALSKEEYLDLVEEVLEEKREEGVIDDDFEFQEARETLNARWPEAAEAASGKRENIDEDMNDLEA